MFVLQVTPDNPVPDEMVAPFNLFLAKKAADSGSGANHVHGLKAIGNKNKSVVFKDFADPLSLANIPAGTEVSTSRFEEKSFTIFKHGTEVKVGSVKNKNGDAYSITALPTLKAGLTEKQSETPVPKASIIEFPKADLYGNVKMKVTNANRHMFRPLANIDARGLASSYSDRTIVECKMTKTSLFGNELRCDLFVINPHDLSQGDGNLTANVQLHSYSMIQKTRSFTFFYAVIGYDPNFIGVRPEQIVEGLHVGDRVFDTLNAPTYPVGVVLQILEDETYNGLAESTFSFVIVVLFDGSDTVRRYPFTDFGKRLVFVSEI